MQPKEGIALHRAHTNNRFQIIVLIITYLVNVLVIQFNIVGVLQFPSEHS